MTAASAFPRFLVLLAAYNGSAWIKEQINSILGQRGVDVRLVAADDGSTDDTIKLLKSLAPRVEHEVRARPSGSAAQNFFQMIRDHEAVACDYVAFADQDDVWHLDRLRRAHDSFERVRWDGYSTATTAVWGDGTQRQLSQNPLPTESDFLFEGAGQGCTFVLAVGFYQRLRKFLLDHPALTSRLHYHDWSTYALARAWGLAWTFDPEPTVSYRQHPRNDTGARLSAGGVAARIARIRNGWYRAQLELIAELAAAANPADPAIRAWRSLLATSPGLRRRIDVARFCHRGGRRKRSDRAILILSAMMGWI